MAKMFNRVDLGATLVEKVQEMTNTLEGLKEQEELAQKDLEKFRNTRLKREALVREARMFMESQLAKELLDRMVERRDKLEPLRQLTLEEFLAQMVIPQS